MDDYWYRRPGRSPLTAITLVVAVAVMIMIVRNEETRFFALLILPIILKFAYDLWQNPTYGVEVNGKNLTILAEGIEIKLGLIEMVDLKDHDGSWSCVIYLRNGRVHKLSPKHLPPNWGIFAEELETRGVKVDRPWRLFK